MSRTSWIRCPGFQYSYRNIFLPLDCKGCSISYLPRKTYLDLRVRMRRKDHPSNSLRCRMALCTLPSSELRAKSFAEKIYPMRRYPGGGLCHGNLKLIIYIRSKWGISQQKDHIPPHPARMILTWHTQTELQTLIQFKGNLLCRCSRDLPLFSRSLSDKGCGCWVLGFSV